MNVVKVKDPVTGEWVRAGLGGTQDHASRHGKDGADPITPEMIGARPDTWMPTAADIGAAPAGYGLGAYGEIKYISSIADLDNFIRNGKYSVLQNIGKPLVLEGVAFNGLFLEVASYSSTYGVQRVQFLGDGGALKRIRLSATAWTPWEWVNPPMVAGKEYRTTERYNGKPVYTMALNFGALPNSTSKTVAHNIPNIAYVISADAIAYNTSAGVPEGIMNTNNHVDYFNVSPVNITICTKNAVSQLTITVNMKYTKTTD